MQIRILMKAKATQALVHNKLYYQSNHLTITETLSACISATYPNVEQPLTATLTNLMPLSH